MKFEFKHRYSGEVKASIGADNFKLAVELAVKNKTDLTFAYIGGAYIGGAYIRGAYLEGAYLEGAYIRGAYIGGAYIGGAYIRGAYLEGAYIGGAYIRGAYLEGAYLEGAYLEGAYIGGAYLEGANLRGADLRGAYIGGANLRGAYIGGAYLGGADLGGAYGEKLILVGDRPVLIIGPIGSRQAYLTAYFTDHGIYLSTGCFFGNLDKFRESVKATHGDSAHAQEYAAAIALIEKHAELWKAEEKKEATA